MLALWQVVLESAVTSLGKARMSWVAETLREFESEKGAVTSRVKFEER